MKNIPNIGVNLRAIRTAQHLSLDKLALKTQVSKAMLGQIERGESSPTVATVWKLATGLNISFSALLINEGVHSTTVQDAKMTVNTLFEFNPISRIEVFDIEIVQFHEQLSQPHNSGVTESIYVRQGQLGLLVKNRWNVLNEGDSYIFEADQSHGYKDLAGHSLFTDIIYYPKV